MVCPKAEVAVPLGINLLSSCLPPVFLRPEEQHCEQPTTGETAGDAPLLREPHGGHRTQPPHQEQGQVGVDKAPRCAEPVANAKITV